MPFTQFYSECPAGSVPYTIRAGDTLNRIASEYNSTLQDIMNANPSINPNALMIGQQICVPLRIQIYPSCPTTNYYVVMDGDTVESIANYFNITSMQLLYSNYGIDPYNLYIDQVLCIPVAPSPVSANVNVSGQRFILYRNGSIFRDYRIAIESRSTPIPRGTFTVLNKQLDPSIEHGARWLGLSVAGCGICGINNPEFINVVATGSNIVMSNQEVSELFNLVPVGTVINIE